jgi:hypothetical protein
VADRRQALIASPDLEACRHIDSPTLPEHLHRSLDGVVETAEGAPVAKRAA